MMSIEYIRQLSRDAGRKAKHSGKRPRIYTTEQLAKARDGDWSELNIPNLGDYRPKGWKLLQEYFVDASGWGQRGEPALTMEQFIEKMKPGLGYATIEAGQFQVYVGEFAVTA